MRNIALRLAYMGTAYRGWQSQPDVPTVSQALQAAIAAVVGHPVRLTGCGRTDSGVHAETYVANFFTSSHIPADRIPYAINTKLPSDIAVYRAADVADCFHSVFSSVQKEYTYRIYSSAFPNPFYADRALFYPQRLNLDAMMSAASKFVGDHEFSSMRTLGSNVRTTRRKMFRCSVEMLGEIIEMRMCANGFLYNMARTIAGTLVYISEGKLSPADITHILQSGDRKLAGPTLPPHGLYMTGVWYGRDCAVDI